MPPISIPLEDDPCDVIAKAMTGHGWTPARLANESGLTEQQVSAALGGEHPDTCLELLAKALQLSFPALRALPHYCPSVPLPDGLERFVSPFGHAGVNAYVITSGSRALVFDTGTDASELIRSLASKGIEIDTLFITHRHHDHTAAIGSFGKIRVVMPEECEHGQNLLHHGFGPLQAVDVSGHLPVARAYYYEGLETPVCVVGDSIFAGSMGKTPDPKSYLMALNTAREHILTLPPETILCPGHGPFSSVKNELQNNPFLAHRSNIV